MRRRGSLWVRIALLGTAIAIVTGVLAGALAIGLIRTADDRSARQSLRRIANTTQTSVTTSDTRLGERARLRALLKAVGIRYGDIGPAGNVRTTYHVVRDALTPAQRARVLAGNNVSRSATVDGQHVYVEARPVNTGGIVLVQARADATAGGEQAIRRTLLAILVGVVVAALLGVLLARRLARPLRRAAGAAHALAQGHRDVALLPEGPVEVAEVAEAVNTLASALSHSEARQREFLMSVSHDLRTPLTAISGYAESLAEGVVPADRTAEVGTVVLGEARRLERLVGDLLDLARLGADDFRLELGDVDLVALARSAAAVWEGRCAAVGVQFRLEAFPSAAHTDAARVRQVLDGLMENALRVTPAGAPIVLAVRTEPDGWACCEVRDGGPGLRDEDLAVAFRRAELYQRYRGVRQVGTGLGLAIVHGLVTRLNGTVEAGHAPEGGARFTVRLPPAAGATG